LSHGILLGGNAWFSHPAYHAAAILLPEVEFELPAVESAVELLVEEVVAFP
jgi:hypothetical protein